MLESSIKNGIMLDYLVKAHVKGFHFLKKNFTLHMRDYSKFISCEQLWVSP